jgi:DNA-binding MarR family transcriptional regulator
MYMGLEQDLKQERFDNVYEKMVVNILFTGSWLSNLNASRLKPFGLTPEQYNVLRILRGSHPKPMMLADITSRMIDRNSNATRLVEKLKSKGFVNREICETNRRQVDISITESGLNVLANIDEGLDQWLENLKTIPQSEAEELNSALDKLRG